MLITPNYFYQYLSPVLKSNYNKSFLDPFLTVLSFSIDGLLLEEYENYLEHSISQLIPGSFDAVKFVTMSSSGNEFYIVQPDPIFASDPTTAIPMAISSSIQDSALSSFKFGIAPLYTQYLISEDLSTVYYPGISGADLNNMFGVSSFNSSTNYSISPDGLITINTSTSADYYQLQLLSLTAPIFKFSGQNAPSPTRTILTGVTGTLNYSPNGNTIVVPYTLNPLPQPGDQITNISFGFYVYGLPPSVNIQSVNVVSSTTVINCDYISNQYLGSTITFNIESPFYNFYIINGRYQQMKIWKKYGQTILSEFLGLLPFEEQLFTLADNWLSGFFAEIVQNITNNATSNYWLTRAVQLVFGLPMCVDDGSVVKEIVYAPASWITPTLTAIVCSSTVTSGSRIYFALGANISGTNYFLNPTVKVGDVLNRYDLFFNTIKVTDYVSEGSNLTSLLLNSATSFDRYLISPFDYDLSYAINLLQRRVAVIYLDPKIPVIFPNYLQRISYIFGKKFPAGFGYVTVNYTPSIEQTVITGSDFILSFSGLINVTKTFGFNSSCLVPASSAVVGLDEDVITMSVDPVIFYSLVSGSVTSTYNIPG